MNATDHPSLKLPAEKRALLFRISSGEFAAKGFNQASLNRITSIMKMSKSSFYHYFSNKNDLFIQTLNHVIEPMSDMRDALDLDALTAETLWPEIMQMMAHASHVASKDPDQIITFRMFFRCYEDPDGRKLIEEILGSFTHWMSKLIQRGQALGIIRKDLPESLLIDIIMSVGMSMDRWMVTNWDEQNDEAREALGAAGFGVIMRILEPV